jgi:SAM-dependent methyltransferase
MLGATEWPYELLAESLAAQPEDRVLDLGCGAGHVLNAVSALKVQRLVGVDKSAEALDKARELLGDRALLFEHDLDDAFPFADGEFNKLLSHNLLECIVDKEFFIWECARVLSSDGLLVLSHSDFDTMVFNSARIDLTRKLIRHYADTIQPWMRTSDPQMGRKLAGLVAQGSLRVEAATGFSTVSRSLEPDQPGSVFLTGVISAARKSGLFDSGELADWEHEQQHLASSGQFFFSVTNFVVYARHR